MTVKEMIKELKKYPNQNAELNIKVNVVDADDETLDINECELSFMEQDVKDYDSYDVLCTLKWHTQNDKEHENLLNGGSIRETIYNNKNYNKGNRVIIDMNIERGEISVKANYNEKPIIKRKIDCKTNDDISDAVLTLMKML